MGLYMLIFKINMLLESQSSTQVLYIEYVKFGVNKKTWTCRQDFDGWSWHARATSKLLKLLKKSSVQYWF